MTVAAHRFNNDLRYRDPFDERQTQLTPGWLVEKIRALLGGIDLDPCTTSDNPVGAKRYFTDKGLEREWSGRTAFVNPPYGKAREPWVQKCICATGGMRVVLLMPAHPDTICFQMAASDAVDVLFLRGRLKFGVLRPNRRQAAASHPSALFGFRVSLEPLAKEGLGLLMTTTGGTL